MNKTERLILRGIATLIEGRYTGDTDQRVAKEIREHLNPTKQNKGYGKSFAKT